MQYLVASETLAHCVASGDQEPIHWGSLYPEQFFTLYTCSTWWRQRRWPIMWHPGTRSQSIGGLCTQNSSSLCTHAVPGGVGDIGPLCGIRGPGANPLGVSVPRTVLYSVHMQYLVASETLAHCVASGDQEPIHWGSLYPEQFFTLNKQKRSKWCCDITVESETAA
jgi:hypothetical protein